MLKKNLCAHKAIAVAAALMSLTLGVSTPALSAGRDVNADYPGKCTASVYNSSIVTCVGTVTGIRRQNVDATRYAYFRKDANGELSFMMVVNFRNYTCYAPTSMNDLWGVAMSDQGYFSVTMDTESGTCTDAVIARGSPFN